MKIVNMLDAKTHLSRLVKELEEGETPQVDIARNGKVVAHLIPATSRAGEQRRFGQLRGKFSAPSLAEFNAADPEIAALFSAGHPDI